jgi:phytoene dehydrogenase-like protein
MANSIIIMGGGIAGLAAGCYGQMNGYRTKIFEMHDIPGGLYTSWEREGYLFDRMYPLPLRYIAWETFLQPMGRVRRYPETPDDQPG